MQLTVRARRQALARQARGRVLDLGGAESHRSLFRRPELDVVRADGASDDLVLGLVDAGERFDTVFSVFQLTQVTDLAGTISRLARMLSPDGQLLFVEPARLTGGAGRAQRLAAPMAALSTGLRTTRDIPGALRTGGLSVTAIERHRIRTTQWWLREVVEGSAHRALPAHRT